MNRFLIGIAVLLSCAACTKKLAIFSSKSDQLNLNNLTYDNVSLKSKIKYKDENRDMKATANIRIKKDSIIWFSLTPGLGIEAARGIITKDSVVILDKIHKQYQVLKIKELSEKYHFSLNLELLEAILVGNLIWPVEKEDEVQRKEGYFQVEKSEGDLIVRNFIGTNSMKLERILAKSDSSAHSMDINYTSFEEVHENVYPSEVTMEINYRSKRNNAKKVSKVLLRHSKIEVDKPNINFSFKVPSKYVPM